MAKTATTAPGTRLIIGDTVFEFGEDGSRQVTEAEIELLEQYERNGGPLKFEISDDPPKKAAKKEGDS